MSRLPRIPNPLRRARLPRLGTFRYSSVELLSALLSLFLITPWVEQLPRGSLIEASLLTLVMISAVLAVGGRRRTLVTALLLVAPGLVARWAYHLRPDLVSPVFFLTSGMMFFLFVVAQLLRFILHAPKVDANVLCAGISGYLMLGLLWALAYLLADQLSPRAFALAVESQAGGALDDFSAFYFSFVTLTTVGYGDILPVSRLARMLAVLESIVGVFYVAVLISRLVAVYSSAHPRGEELPPAG